MPEWVAVATSGKILVRDDGRCRGNGYCIPNKDGTVTANDKGYRVMKRISKNKY